MWNKTIDADLLEQCFMENLIEVGENYTVEQALWDAIGSCMDLSGSQEEYYESFKFI